MVDRLKASVEELEPPACPNCRINMKWIRSLLLDAVEPATIGHFFQCNDCGRVKETRSKVRTINDAIKRPKLSKPAAKSSWAA
jgi:hypothetical protein